MTKQGSFGYKIGRKIRLMRVDEHAELLWQILVREIYVLIKYYGSIEKIQELFTNLLETKHKPKVEVIEKCKIFANFNFTEKKDWKCLTRYCQNSFINVLESGYFLNNGEKIGLLFILDFNTKTVRFFSQDYDKKITEYNKASIDEIMNFEDMPIKTYKEIVTEMWNRFELYNRKITSINLEIEKINNVIKKTKKLGGDENVISGAKRLLYNMEYEKNTIVTQYRFFYHRLDALNLIEHET